MCNPEIHQARAMIQKSAGRFGARIAKAQRLVQSTVGGGTPPPGILDGILPPAPTTDIAAIRKITTLGV
jgi:hypothetical protein|tara:strand:+ start:442 stop:648 length:207 start_codon:yes stop_codon:yes gene_type:complete